MPDPDPKDAVEDYETVPLYVPLVCYAEAPEMRIALESCGRRLLGPAGEQGRTEIDLDLVAARVDPRVADHLRAYFHECRRFWYLLEHGRSPGAYVALRRPLVRAVQIDSKRLGKAMLHAELEALEELPGAGAAVTALLERERDENRIREAAAPFAGRLALDGTRTQLDLVVEGRLSWPLALGGAGTAGEVRRHLRLRANHAPSRDRASRRLMAVEIDTEEIWPDPLR